MQEAAAKKVAETAAAAVVREALEIEGMSAEERAVTEREERERKIRAIVGSLMDLASSSGVAKERSLFMDLMRNEIDRVNKQLAEKSGGCWCGCEGSRTGNYAMLTFCFLGS